MVEGLWEGGGRCRRGGDAGLGAMQDWGRDVKITTQYKHYEEIQKLRINTKITNKQKNYNPA